MPDFNAPGRQSDGPRDQALKTCPWCHGRLVFEPSYPVIRLFPGGSRILADHRLPKSFRTVPVWACGTPHCKFRKPA